MFDDVTMWNDCKDELKTHRREYHAQKNSHHRQKIMMTTTNLVRIVLGLMKMVIMNKNQTTLLDSLLIELFLMISQLVTIIFVKQKKK